jgi:DNA polymerase I-like protein with 3'-5' exonuclease and polymerase domains
VAVANKEFIYQRICIFTGKDIDPHSDQQVEEMLRNKFNIHLPQRQSMNESLAAAISDHEIISLIQQYRALTSA